MSSHAEKELRQALADKAVLVQALQSLTRELAASRMECRRHAEALQHAMASAHRLGQIGLQGLELANFKNPHDGAGQAGCSTLDVSPNTPQSPRAGQGGIRTQ